MPPPGRSCAEQPARVTRQKAATLPAVGALEAPPRRDDEQQQPGSELFEYPQQPAAAAKLKDRARRVALADGECPAETGDGPILRIMTIALILAVNDAVNELWKENADEIKKRCGPSMPKGLIDRQELFAFVLNDVLGRPLLPHDAAREVGQSTPPPPRRRRRRLRRRAAGRPSGGPSAPSRVRAAVCVFWRPLRHALNTSRAAVAVRVRRCVWRAAEWTFGVTRDVRRALCCVRLAGAWRICLGVGVACACYNSVLLIVFRDLMTLCGQSSHRGRLCHVHIVQNE